MKAALFLACIAVLATAAPALSCSVDDDCRPGKKCITAPGQTTGVCVEGELEDLVVGEDEETEETIQQAAKNPCQFDRQCDPNEYCFRLPNDEYGICVKK